VRWDALALLWESALIGRATLMSVVVGALCGAVGVHVVLRRLTFYVASIGHASLPAMVVAARLGIPVQAGAAAATAGFASVVARGAEGDRTRPTELTGVVVAASLGLGVLLQSLDGAPRRDLSALLTGSILSTTPGELAWTTGAAVLALLTVAALHHRLVMGALDPVGSELLPRHRTVDLTVTAVVGLAVIVALPAVGTLLVLALAVVPAAAGLLVAGSVARAMVTAGVVGALSGALGMAASVVADVAAGAAIALASGLVFAVLWALSRLRRPGRREQPRAHRPDPPLSPAPHG
jgi:ABC-type Mn2+/Zn2+ transport system permease subunit